ncbi:14465_t:CDS:2, partial [Rhizophagus irregularis]
MSKKENLYQSILEARNIKILFIHCSSQKHTLNVKKYEENQNKTQQLTLNSTQITSNSKKQLIEDLIEAFAIADIPLEKVNSLLPFFKKYIKNSDSIPQASKFTYQ